MLIALSCFMTDINMVKSAVQIRKDGLYQNLKWRLLFWPIKQWSV